MRRLSLLALSSTLRCLVPLAEAVLKSGAAVTLAYDRQTTHQMPADLPSAIEIVPWDAQAELLTWSDYIAIDLALDDLAILRHRLGIKPGDRLFCPAQVLVHTAMPCGGAADCGVCGVRMKRGWKLACKDGPVFTLEELDW